MKATFNRKESLIRSQEFSIGKAVELGASEYAAFCQNLLDSQSFIEEFKDQCYTRENGVANCLLVLCEGQDDGVLVLSEGYEYARYTSHLPCARQIAMLQNHPSLDKYTKMMGDLAEHYAMQAVEAQLDCQYRLSYDDVSDYCEREDFDEDLFTDMLAERPEIESVEADTEGFDIIIAQEYIQAEEPRKTVTNDDSELDIICAKHILWLNDAGGEQADFSGCLLDGLNLSGKNLLSAKFDNAMLINVKMKDASLCGATFNGTKFYYCDLELAVAEESEFKNARFYGCNLDKAVLTHSDMTDVKFVDCTADRTSFQNCCVQSADFGNIYCGDTDMRGVSQTQEEWQAQFDGINMEEIE